MDKKKAEDLINSILVEKLRDLQDHHPDQKIREAARKMQSLWTGEDAGLRVYDPELLGKLWKEAGMTGAPPRLGED